MPIQSLTTHGSVFVTVRELADYWLVSARQIHKYIENGRLPAIRMGRSGYRIPTKAAAEFERNQMVRPLTTRAAAPQQAANLALIRGDRTDARTDRETGRGVAAEGGPEPAPFRTPERD